MPGLSHSFCLIVRMNQEGRKEFPAYAKAHFHSLPRVEGKSQRRRKDTQKDMCVSLGLKPSPNRQQRKEEPHSGKGTTAQDIFTDGRESIKDRILGDKQMIYLFYCLARDYQELRTSSAQISNIFNSWQKIVRNLLQYRRNAST